MSHRTSEPQAGGGRPVAALTPSSLDAAVAELAARDPDLAGIVARYGPPPLWDRAPGFATLLHIILEQQVSLASAQAAFDRLRVAARAADARPGSSALATRSCWRSGSAARRRATGGRWRRRVDVGHARPRRAATPRRRRRPRRARGDARDRAVDLDDLPADGPRPARRLAGRRHRARAGGRRGQGPRPTGPDRTRWPTIGEAWRPWRSVAARLFWHDYLGASRSGGLSASAGLAPVRRRRFDVADELGEALCGRGSGAPPTPRRCATSSGR